MKCINCNKTFVPKHMLKHIVEEHKYSVDDVFNLVFMQTEFLSTEIQEAKRKIWELTKGSQISGK